MNFDYRAQSVAMFQLVNINTSTDGDVGFILGADGQFTDLNGKTWYGSTLFGAGRTSLALNGRAPAGELTMSYFQDPTQPDVIDQLQALGPEYVRGRPVTFWLQVFYSFGEMQAPEIAPVLTLTRVATSLTFSHRNALQRGITLAFESVGDLRRTATHRVYGRNAHELLIGAPDPSLEFMPDAADLEQPLFA